MSRNGSGVYSLPAGNPVTTGTTISSTWANTTLSDIATALTQSIAYNGVTTPIANLPMGGYKLTGLGVATTSGDALSYGNAITASSIVGTSVTDSGLTSGRVTYASTGGLLADSASLTFDGTNLGIANINGATLSLKTGGTTGLYIDGSQNVGIGTSSPSTYAKLTTFGNFSSTFGVGVIDTTSGSSFSKPFYCSNYTDSDFQLYLSQVGAASKYAQLGTGTATPLVFMTNSTERMRIDSSGSVGIGTSSPGYLLSVSKNGGGGDSGQLARFTDTSTSNSVGPFHLTMGATNHFASNPSPVIAGTNGLGFAVGDGSDLAGQRKMMIDSSGNVGIGTSSPSATLNVASNSATQVKFYKASGGGDNYLRVNYSNSASSAYFETAVNPNNTASSGTFNFYSSSYGDMLKLRQDGFFYAPVIYGATSASGANVGVAADGLMYRNTSALKYKTDVRDIESIDISKFRPVRYKSICEMDDKEKEHFGFIADEIDDAGIKELVNYGENGEVEGFQYERLTVVLTKAIQEQQALITQLQADVAALKNGNTPSV